jgi:polysaccharide biosynthesis/export protein
MQIATTALFECAETCKNERMAFSYNLESRRRRRGLHPGSGMAVHPVLSGMARPSAARWRWMWLLAMPVVLALASCTSAPVTTEKLKLDVVVLDTVRKFEHMYVVQPGDQLEVFLSKHGEYSRKVTVRSDGYISLPLLDEVKVAGKTPRDLATELQTLFTQRLRNPDVNVIVLNPPEPMVYVVGQIGAPKALPLRQAATLAQAVAQSGDATKMAAIDSISVVRLNEQGYLESHLLDTHGKNVSQPEVYMAMAAVLLKPNDLIVVPESYRSQLLRVLQDTSIAIAPLFNVLLLREVYR